MPVRCAIQVRRGMVERVGRKEKRPGEAPLCLLLYLDQGKELYTYTLVGGG
jgi:hypothetical protein